MAARETHEYDVVVVGAGGAGLRAAIEASAKGAKVGLVSKSLLGKANSVMAEGGMAAALRNVDDRDGWAFGNQRWPHGPNGVAGDTLTVTDAKLELDVAPRDGAVLIGGER